MGGDTDRGPLIVFANFVSDLAVDLSAHDVLDQWAAQATGTIWLMHKGDVLVTPVPLSEGFQRYARDLLALPARSLAIVTVPPHPGVPMAEALRHAGLATPLGKLAAERGGVKLLPTALDAATVAFAEELGVQVAPYGPSGVGTAALEITSRLNTKAGFRRVAASLGIRLPHGRVCRRDQLPHTVEQMLRRRDRVVIKPDRSAGGYGLRFVSRAEARGTDAGLDFLGGPHATWLVEEHLDVTHSVSIQLETGPRGTQAVYSGEMRTTGGSFTGYVAPLTGAAAQAESDLRRWGTALGRHLADHGYAGPFCLDAVLTRDGSLYATESNVRRTATTTPHAMVTRLADAAGLRTPAWLVGTHRDPPRPTFAEALDRLRRHDLRWDPVRGEGTVLYADAPRPGDPWRYAIIAGRPERATALETRLRNAMDWQA